MRRIHLLCVVKCTCKSSLRYLKNQHVLTYVVVFIGSEADPRSGCVARHPLMKYFFINICTSNKRR